MSKVKIVVAFCLLVASQIIYAKAVPEFFMEYAFMLDKICPTNQTDPISDEMIDKVVSYLPAFSDVWKENGLPLANIMYQTLGKSLDRNELTLDLSLCGNNLSMSYPFIVNVRRDLLQPGNYADFDQEHFTFVTFHMFIFRYVYPLYADMDSKLLEKYKNETYEARAHLFPHAIL